MESIKYFLCLLEVDAFWPILIIALLALKAICPWQIEGKSIQTKDKDGNIVKKYYKY